MKALTLHQPWAQLCITDVCPPGHGPHPVKWIETRSWPAPKALIGQRIAIHASARRPEIGRYAGGLVMGAYASGETVARSRCYVGPTDLGPVASGCTPVMLPLGAVVGSAVLAACVPMVGPDGDDSTWTDPLVVVDAQGVMLYDALLSNGTDLTDQLPFGEFAPGRWAWILADAAPTTERCPACWGSAHHPSTTTGELIHAVFTVSPFANRLPLRDCPVCDGAGRCAPISAKGRQRVWEWAP